MQKKIFYLVISNNLNIYSYYKGSKFRSEVRKGKEKKLLFTRSRIISKLISAVKDKLKRSNVDLHLLFDFFFDS